MSFKMNRSQRVGTLFNATLALIVLAGGCSSSNAPDLAEFTIDFAREVLAAWLL